MRDESDAEFAAFMATSYPSLLRTAVLLTGDRGNGEDLVQNALMKTYGRWRNLEDPANAEAYTRRVLVRQALKSRRRRWRGEVPTEPLPETAVADPTIQVEIVDAVRSGLLALPATQRAVLVLRYFEDRSEADIAELLGCSVGTVKSRASRALAALRLTGLGVHTNHPEARSE